MDDDLHDYIPKSRTPYRPPDRFPPRVRQPGPPEGEDYFTLTEKHGRPIGVFEQHGRQVQYREKT